jgi:hypothetical protein
LLYDDDHAESSVSCRVEHHRAGRDAGRCRSEVDVEELLLPVQENEVVEAVEADHHDALQEVAVELWDTA